MKFHARFPRSIRDPVGGWRNRLKSHLQARTMPAAKGERFQFQGFMAATWIMHRLEPSSRKGLQIRAGQTHVHRYMKPLLDHIAREEIDPTMIISHRLTLDEAPSAYKMFAAKHDACTKA